MKCVLQCAHSVGERRCVKGTACVSNMVCVVASVPKCVLPSTPCVSEGVCVTEAPCVRETPCASEARCVRETACVRTLCVREMTVGMREHATACPGVNVMLRCVCVVARGSLCARVRRRRQQMRDKSRLAAGVVSGTVPGWHSSEREVRAVLRTRPPRARLRE